MLQTEYAFTLPRGYVDEHGDLHRDGVMRLATALDEIAPHEDTRVRANDVYIGVLLISRVVTRLGGIAPVPVSVIERLFAGDFVYLQNLYVRINGVGSDEVIETACPQCGTHFLVDLRMEDAV